MASVRGAKSEKELAAERRAAMSAEIPAALRATFNDIFKMVEEKQYKRAIKNADIVLKKVPTHGTSMSMKALAMYNMGRKEEAHELAKAGLKHDLKCVRASLR